MTTVPTGGFVGHLRRVVLRQDLAGLTDGQLLECFLARRDDVAFEMLVRRHGPMVLGVCRRVLRHHQDAEDAFQATFLVLVRKAAGVVPREAVGNWLYGVAYRTAAKARTRAARRDALARRLRERCRPEATVEPGPADLWFVLDRELSRLPDCYRVPLVLCDLEGKTRGEVSRQLRVPEGTVSSRLARARRLLARRLTRRGVALSAAAAGAEWCRPAAPAVPPPLVISTVKAALSGAAGKAAASGLVSAEAAALAEGVIRAMWMRKLQTVAVVLMIAGLVGSGAGALAHRAWADRPAPDECVTADKPKDDVGPTIPATVRAADAKTKTITLAVQVDPAKKETAEKTFDLAPDVKVVLEHGLRKETKEGKLADLAEGTPCSVQFAPDKKTVLRIQVRGGSVRGHLKAADPTRNTVTVTVKESTGPADKTLELDKEAKVILDDGIGKKNDAPKEGKLADLAEGTSVVVHLSGYDQKTAVGVVASGPTCTGSVKGVDAGNNTITVISKDDGTLQEKTFTVSKDARVEGKLTDLAEGTPVTLRLSVFDKKTVVAVHVRK